uniref:L-TrfA n=1 Tax=Plasmid R751 TaxID=2496 RepID=Q56466_9ZZZZ|nr:L-TrfA [Plasmid R751]
MQNEFNEQEYRRKLIEGGLSEARRHRPCRPYRRRSQGLGQRRRAFRPAVPSSSCRTAGDNEAALPPKLPTPASAAVERSERMAQESAELARTMGLPPEPRTAVNKMAEQIGALAQDKRSSAMATKKRTAGGELAEKVSEAKQTALLKHTKQQIKDMQLSLFDLAPWTGSHAALPNDFGRSAIFTVRNKKVPRPALQGQSIYHVNKDVEITYTGIELRADDDELVFAQVLEYANGTALGEPVSFTFYELCQDLDWSINGRYYTRAEECLTRLQASAMQFSSQRIGRLESVSLIRRFRVLDRGKRTSRCQVEIDAEIVVLFAGDHYTKFVWEKYRKLSPNRDGRMFDYFATHKEPYPLKLETFRLMCGSDSTRPKKWREQVGEACDELRENGLVESAWVNDDLVHCKR